MPRLEVKKKKKSSLNEEDILREIHDIYTTKLHPVSEFLSLPFITPRRKISVMIIGNHSAGKSSFINWYTGVNANKTGTACESQGFNICTKGEEKEGDIKDSERAIEFKGEGSLKFFPQLQDIINFGPHILSYLTTTVIHPPKLLHRFDVVDLIDTPGLVDGNVQYPFDVDGAIEALAAQVDMVLVFLDPIGQSLCTRTMNVVERLNVVHYKKIRYYLSKADSIERLIDLLKVSQQLTQNLAQRVKNTHGFYISPIFLSHSSKNNTPHPLSEINEIGKLCFDIELIVKEKVQGNLSVLEKDVTKYEDRLNEVREKDLKAFKKKIKFVTYAL